MIKKITSSKSLLYLFFLISLFGPYLLTKLFNHEKLVYIITAIFFVFLAVYIYISDNETSNFIFNPLLKFSEVINLKIYYLALLLFTFITQNVLLNYESITWDVASYLVASLPIEEGYLPYEVQWESKGPLLIYIYYFLVKLSSGSYIIFRLINDVILFLISLFLFKSIYTISKQKSISITGSILFLSIFSDPEYVSEYSELYVLLFVSIAFYIYLSKEKNRFNYFIIGFIISLASLVNQVAAIFCLPYIFNIINEKNDKKTKFYFLLFGLVIPQIMFQLLYFFNGLYDIYLFNYILLPLGYSNSVEVDKVNELRIWLREFFHYNKYLYFSIVSFCFIEVLRIVKNFSFNLFNNIVYFQIFIAISIYFLGGTGYSHHLWYFVFFLIFLTAFTKDKKVLVLFSMFVVLTSGSIFYKSYEKSTYNILNFKEVESNYPVYKLAQELKKYTNSNSSVFALEYVLVLFYLDKINYSYIVHPTNHFEEYITKPLISMGRIQEDNVGKLLLTQPDIILCNSVRIHAGVPTYNYNFDCNYASYKDSYFQLDTETYRTDKTIEYFYDPYKPMNVFVKKNN